MTHDAPTTTVSRRLHVVRSEVERQALLAEFERWDGTQADFCEAKSVSTKTFRSWRRRYAPAAAATAGKPASFVEIEAAAGPADPESGTIRPDRDKIWLANHTSPGEEMLKRRNKPLQFNPLQTAQTALRHFLLYSRVKVSVVYSR